MNNRLVILFGLVLCLVTGQASAFINNPNYLNNRFNYGSWANLGDIRIVGPKKCVMSTDGRNKRSGNPSNYTVTASMTTGDGVFQLTRNGGGAAIAFSLEYEWFDDASSTNEVLAYNTPGNPHLGGINTGGINCNLNGSQVRNGRLILQIDEAELTAAQNGDYEGRLTIVHTGGIAMSQTSTRSNLRVSLSKSATAIQLRNLSPVNLGTWDPTANFLADREAYCVYSSTGNYRVTASSPTTGSSGASSFAIEHTTLPGDKIDYELYIDDDDNASTGGTLIDNGGTLAGMVATTDNSCPGDNAAIYVVTTGSLASRAAGNYAGLITLTVEPE